MARERVDEERARLELARVDDPRFGFAAVVRLRPLELDFFDPPELATCVSSFWGWCVRPDYLTL